MKRHTGIPFVAWIGTAVLAHLLWTAGGERVARVVEDMTDLRLFAESVRGEFAQGQDLEITLEEVAPEEPQDADEAKQPDPASPKLEEVPPEKPKLEPPEVPAKPKRDPPIQLVPVPKQLEDKPKQPPPPIEQPKKDQRIAVKQHVEDKNQEDNPNARFVGDEANRVKEESVARITSHDQDDPNPTPGGQHSGADQKPGNADETKIGDSEDREGEPDHAPGERVAEAKEGNPDKPPDAPKPLPPSAGRPDAPKEASNAPAARPAPQPAPTSEPARPDHPDPVTAGNGSYSLDPRRKTKPVPSVNPVQRPRPNPGRVGLGAGPNERGVRTSLNMTDVVQTVGADELSRARAADGERRRSQHRGSWKGTNFERWRGAIENYVSSVRPGNQTALNTARVPFATYLVQIHNRLHPVFADTFLASLDALPFDHPINDYKLYAALEIVVEPNTGRIVKMGVTKTSGITGFDVGALDSVQRASPFGKAPPAIISSDGNVYLHWEFHRNPIYACSTMNARPFILNNPPAIDGPDQHPPRDPQPPSDPRERGVPPPAPAREGSRSRYGRWDPLPRPRNG